VSRANESEIPPLSAAGLQWEEEAAIDKVPQKKDGWPDFPFFWMKQPDMSSLRDIALRLQGKVETFRCSGVTGETTPAEKQIINLLSAQQQQMLEMHDAFQAALQIIDDNRPSQRLKRLLRRVTWAGQRVVLRLRSSTALTILGAVSTVVFVITGLIYLIHLFRR
jgi:hypothetical protein